jgi:hypothetical protein
MRGGAMAKSTFVTAPSFASSSSVTSINHVPRVPVPSRNTPILAYTRDPSYRSPPYFPPPPRPISLLSVSPFFMFFFFFFYLPLYTPPARTLFRKCIRRTKMRFREPPYRTYTLPTQRFECFSYFSWSMEVFRERTLR